MNNELVLSPTDFVAIVNQTLEVSMPFVTIVGELSEYKVRKGRWLYFKLKDEYASLDCFGTIHMQPGPLEDGMMLKIVGRARLHPAFGFSFNVSSISPAGEGTIKKVSDLLREKMTKEGLFEPARKRPLPYPPRTVCVITSSEGAAVADFKKIMSGRWPATEITVLDSLVQGAGAPDALTQAIEDANKDIKSYDVLVITRGGGSAEDLSAFNDERVVRAVAASRIPTMVAIGHEVDESLSELAADAKASTPSNAAELLVPDRVNEISLLQAKSTKLYSALQNLLARENRELEHASNRIRHMVGGVLLECQDNLVSSQKLLASLSPLRVLDRGFAVVTGPGGKVVKSAAGVANNMDIRFADGQVQVKLDKE